MASKRGFYHVLTHGLNFDSKLISAVVTDGDGCSIQCAHSSVHTFIAQSLSNRWQSHRLKVPPLRQVPGKFL